MFWPGEEHAASAMLAPSPLPHGQHHGILPLLTAPTPFFFTTLTTLIGPYRFFLVLFRKNINVSKQQPCSLFFSQSSMYTVYKRLVFNANKTQCLTGLNG